jgi:hypothetical protein
LQLLTVKLVTLPKVLLVLWALEWQVGFHDLGAQRCELPLDFGCGLLLLCRWCAGGGLAGLLLLLQAGTQSA